MTDVEAGETTPLVGATPTDEAPLQDMKTEAFKEKTVAAVAGTSFVLSLLTLIFQSALNPIVFLSGVLGILIAPAAALQQHKLTQVEALAQTNERLASEVDQLTAERGRLTASVNSMEESVLNLQAMEKTLETLQAVQGQSVDELEHQLVASKDILRRIRTSQRGQVLQNLISVLLSADTEGNMELDDDDIERLIQRLEQMHEVDIDDAKVKALIIENGRSVEAVMELARSAFLSESSKEDAVFKFLAETPAS